MASDLPAGFTLDEPVAAKGGDLPAGYKLDEAAPAAPEGMSLREKELRVQYLQDQLKSGDPGYSARLKDSATLGLIRPLGGLMRGVSGVLDPTSTFGERYRAGVGAEEDYAKRAVENTNPILGAATDVAGVVGGAPVAAGRATLGKLIAQSAGTGAVEGAARNAESPEKATTGAAVGGAIGAGTSAAVGSAAKLIPGMKGAQEATRKANQGDSPAEIKAGVKPLYNLLDTGGIGYGGVQTQGLKQGIDDLVANNQYNKIAHSKISGYVDELLQKTQQPQGMSFNELNNLRSALATEARGNDAGTRGAASKVIEKIDEMVTKNAPAINPTGTNVADTVEKARKGWKAASLAEDVGWTADKVERKAASKAGVNPDEAARDAFRKIEDKISKPGAYSPYGEEGSTQRDLLAKIVQGDKLQNTYRNIGGVVGSPVTRSIVGLGSAALGLHGALGPVSALSGVGGAAAGGGLKGTFDRMAAARGQQHIDELIRNITGSQPKSIPPDALRTLLAKQQLQRGGAAYGGSLTGE